MTEIYHITHGNNLARIIELDGLYCDNERKVMEINSVGIAHQTIKDRRAKKQILICKYGTLADYVPFYFAARSPMLYSIHKKSVEGYTGSQEDVIHLCSSVEAVKQNGMPFCFTDGHAAMEISEFYTDLKDLEKLDWEIMEASFWADTVDDGDRKRRRQAEFLVHRFFPWTKVTKIGVKTDHVARLAESKLQITSHVPDIVVHPEWYY